MKKITLCEGKFRAYADSDLRVHITSSSGGEIAKQSVEAILLLEIIRLLKAKK